MYSNLYPQRQIFESLFFIRVDRLLFCGAPAMCILRKSKALLAVPAWSDGVLGLALLWPFSLVCKIKQQW